MSVDASFIQEAIFGSCVAILAIFILTPRSQRYEEDDY